MLPLAPPPAGASRKERAVGEQEGAARISVGRVAKLPLLTAAAGSSQRGLEMEQAAV